MRAVPAEVSKRWGAMWAPDAHSERPWWCAVHSTIMSGPLVRWRRSDGRETGYYKVPVTWGTHDDPGLFFLDTPRAELARIDAAHPLPTPPPMPGQVWCWAYDVCGNLAKAPYENIVTHVSFNEFVRFDTQMTMMENWPQPNTILVAGPTPWGRDCPWSPA